MQRDQGWKTFIPFRRIPRSKRNELPVNHVGLFSFLTLSWLDGIMWQSFRRKLDPQKMWRCPPTDGTHFTQQEISELWQQEISVRGKDAKLSSALFKYIRTRLIIGSIIVVIALAGLFVMSAYVIQQVLASTWRTDLALWEGIVLAIVLFCLNVFNSILFVASFCVTQVAGGRVRNGTLGLLYHKLITCNHIPNNSIGKILNVFASDGQRLYDGVSYMPMLFGGPVLILAGTGVAVYLLGPWAILGAVITLLLFPLQGMAGKCFMKFRGEAVILTDKRVRLMTEYISNMKFIKMYTWEQPLTDIIHNLRNLERKVLEKVNIALSIAFITGGVVVSTATMVTLIAYVMSGNQLNGIVAFTYVALYASIQERMELTSMSIRSLSEFFVAANRIQEALLLPSPKQESTTNAESDYIVKITNASFSWPKEQTNDESDVGNNIAADSNNFNNHEMAETEALTEKINRNMDILRDITIKVTKGSVVGIVGPVGSGKSALLSAMLGQLEQTGGDMQLNGSFAYVPQQPWIFNASLRENILLGEEYDDASYNKIIDACSLKHDLNVLPAGDMTEIGERGINLSGGQKQRVSLARALYADRQIYLLDDPLASVDPDVAKHIYSNVVHDLLIGKTVFIVSNDLKFLDDTDMVICINGGDIIESGSPDELNEQQGHYSRLHQLQDQHTILADHSSISLEQNSSESAVSLKETSQPDSGGDLTGEEEKVDGAVGWKTYAAYLKAAGGVCSLLVVIILALLAEGTKAFSFWWLAIWIRAHKQEKQINVTSVVVSVNNINETSDIPYEYDAPDDIWKYHLVYGCTLIGILIFFLIRSVVLVKFLMKASSRMHNWLFEKILRCPMEFFDTTPLGRILNRFSRDLDELDAKLPPLVDSTIRTLVSLFLYLILIAVIVPWVLVTVPVIILVFVLLYSMFRVGTRDFKRNQLISMSPLLSHINASLDGLASIKAYNKENQFYNKLTKLLDDNSVWLNTFSFTMRWINVRLSIVTSALLALTCLVVLLVKNDLPMEFAGTAIIYAIQILSLTQLFVRFAVEAEATFTSAERICSYIRELQPENDKPIKRFPISDEWPTKGAIDLKNFSLRYREELPLVLQNISLSIEHKEKIGIVGRTGSGKSSLVSALFRLVEHTSGSLCIDDIDTNDIYLQQLRSKVAIIPQDPILFSGSVRYNLDPLNQHIDMEIWRELEKCHMKETISNLDLKLDSPVSERGENFSVGERQLLSMARVLLRRTKILILDEATAAIDNETSQQIHRTLTEEFADTTLLIIAHRLETIRRCDRILVMDGGQVAEFNTPDILLNDKDSLFSRMMSSSSADRASVRPSSANAWV